MAQSEGLARARQMYSDLLADIASAEVPTIEHQREAFVRFYERFDLPEDASVTEVDAGGVPAVWVAAPGVADDQVMIHFHGGGFAFGNAAGYLPFGYDLSKATGGRVLMVDYRLAPEHPFPAALDDGSAAYRHVLGTGVPASRVLLSGDSAGGALAVGVALAARDGDQPQPGGIVLFSPLLDLAGEAESLKTRADRDPLVSAEMVGGLTPLYLGEGDPKATPLASPMHAELAGLAPVIAFVGTDEALYDDPVRFVDRVREAGGRAELVVHEDMIHVYPIFNEFLAEAREALDQLGKFARDLSGSSVV